MTPDSNSLFKRVSFPTGTVGSLYEAHNQALAAVRKMKEMENNLLSRKPPASVNQVHLPREGTRLPPSATSKGRKLKRKLAAQAMERVREKEELKRRILHKLAKEKGKAKG